jgi:hypothetical protein
MQTIKGKTRELGWSSSNSTKKQSMQPKTGLNLQRISTRKIKEWIKSTTAMVKGRLSVLSVKDSFKNTAATTNGREE